jgi:CMP-N,N'-diacetyllegionaminic acid synthase
VHSIEHAMAARSVDEVVVSTDDDEIAEVARGAGARVVLRPAALAADDAPTLPVLTHVLGQLGSAALPSRVVTLQPTSPLRTPRHIDEAVALLAPGYDAVVGVSEVEHSPYKMFRILGETLHPLLPEMGPGTPRQALPPVYRENGAVYVTWTRVLLESGSIWGLRTRPYLMDSTSSVDIDSLLDFQLAELILQSRGERS